MLFCILILFSPTLIYSYKIVDALDSNIWDSSVRVHEHSCQAAVPYLCEFTNTYVDLARIYLVPKKKFMATATVDLYNCCKDVFLFGIEKAYSCNGSIKRSLCSCVSGAVAMPSIWTQKQRQLLSNPVENFTGVTWLMNHHVCSHHPDHFNMRVLEIHNMVAISKHALHADCYESFPRNIDSMLSMDYPNDRTEYEKLIMKIVQQQINVSFTSLNIHADWRFYLAEISRNRTVFEPFANALEELSPIELSAEAKQLLEQSKMSYKKIIQSSLGKSRVGHLEKSFYSPNYKNNIPRPMEYSIAATAKSVATVLAAESGGRISCVSKNSNSSKGIQVAILQRIDGNGKRRFVNLDLVARMTQTVFKLSSLRILYIDGTTPPIEQASAFCSVHLIISPHSSQLSNLMFSAPKIALIELQPPLEVFDTSFRNLAHSFGMHYQVFGNEIYPRPMIANITKLHIALLQAKTHLKNEGDILY